MKPSVLYRKALADLPDRFKKIPMYAVDLGDMIMVCNVKKTDVMLFTEKEEWLHYKQD